MVAAWEKVRSNRGARGPDGVTVGSWGHDWETRLTCLIHQVRTNTYQPSIARTIFIPKKSGGSRKLSILTVTDRVLQRAVLQIIYPMFNRRFFPCSFGYRRNRSLQDAVLAIVEHREAGCCWVLDADIQDCFGSLDHGLLLSEIEKEIDDLVVLNLIRLWLNIFTCKHSDMSGQRPNRKNSGVALGAPLSPLFCNIYLHRLDEAMVDRSYPLVRYADDFVVLAKRRAIVEIQLKVVLQALTRIRLCISQRKTRITSFDKGFQFLGVKFYRREFSYMWKDRKIRVRGDGRTLPSEYLKRNY